MTRFDSIRPLYFTHLCVTAFHHPHPPVAFRIYDMDKDGYISNGELFQVLKMMVGNNLKDTQLQQIVDKTIINADKDGDGRISFEEFCAVSLGGPLGLRAKVKISKGEKRTGETLAANGLACQASC